MDDKTRSILAQVNTALIRYPRFKALHSDIRECQEMSRLANEPQCMALEGVTGAGKSTLVQDYAALFPRIEQTDGTRIPIFYAETPSPVTVKGMAATLLARLGDPGASHGTLWAMNFRLIRLMIDCQVELVILDDFHHLIDKETNRILEQVSDWLKVLIKETGIPFLVVGIEGKVERILETNAQLSRLFAVRQTLQPFRFDLCFPQISAGHGFRCRDAAAPARMDDRGGRRAGRGAGSGEADRGREPRAESRCRSHGELLCPAEPRRRTADLRLQ